ncbi:nuclear transport factor 2 family protein [Sphingobacterium sp.]|uniref:nuclear transport factor 2 family protein n=1 Tax=Sphingobacterium sp. TaxID=341027 RepID=UPI0031D788F5
MDVNKFALDWIESWNSHNLENILNHYTDDIEIITPMIKMALGSGNGNLKGKTAVSEYWKKALDKLPDLHFELYEITAGVGCISLFYQSVMNKKAIETMFYNDEGKIYKMIACYTD